MSAYHPYQGTGVCQAFLTNRGVLSSVHTQRFPREHEASSVGLRQAAALAFAALLLPGAPAAISLAVRTSPPKQRLTRVYGRPPKRLATRVHASPPKQLCVRCTAHTP